MKSLLLGLFLAGSLALPSHAFAEDFKPSSNVVTLMPLLLDNLELLNVTQEQLSEIRQISRKNFAEVEYINAQYHNLKSELKDELLDVNVNAEHSLKLAQELAQLEQKRFQLTINCANGLKNLLSASQYEELIGLLEFQS
ncbi:MAG: hypothetical protein JXK16_12365 [Thiotrichales bacterium]|nr:hypothetical protein [Thiotrichales bacterium]